jgi:hypothetical protein
MTHKETAALIAKEITIAISDKVSTTAIRTNKDITDEICKTYETIFETVEKKLKQ